MTITPTSFNRSPIPTQTTIPQQPQKQKPLPAVKMGLASTVLWGSLNFGTDRLFSKLLKYESKMSTSLIFSGIIGVGMGLLTYFKIRKLNKQEENTPTTTLNKTA